ncbi:MAG: hypothetical protein ACKOUR_20140, partial [Planctomycetota bacterium]
MIRKSSYALIAPLALTLATTWQLIAPTTAAAQFRGGRDAKEYIRNKDRNGNGLLEPDELSGRAKEVLEKVAGASGIDLSKPIPVDRAIQIFEQNNPEGGGGGPGGGPPGGGPPGSPGGGWSGRGGPAPGSSPTSSPAVASASGSSGPSAGFGELPKVPKTAGFSDAGLGLNAIALDSRFDRRVLDYVERMFREFDRNQNQLLEDLETRSANGLIDRDADTNKDGFITKAELCERVNQKWAATSTGAAALAARSAPRSSASGSGASGSAASEEAQRVRRYAEGLLKQYDENKNGQLEKNEWANARSITRETDANNDGVITLEELVAKRANFGKENSSRSSTASSGAAGSGRPGEAPAGGSGWGGRSRDPAQAGKNGPEKMVGYRQRTALEKLPKGLPDWFTRNDANEDGQVTMAEFATGWTEAKATEFAGFDLNRDGVVTPSECLKAAEKAKTSGTSSSGRSSFGS